MNGHNASMLHFGQIWPLNRDAVREAIGSRERVISVEGNAWGQFACVLREQGLIGEVELLTRYDGLPFTAEEIVARVEG
jgi:2-oxoglutarate ferredoxin oxidoreductase subunit alpha